MLDIIFKYLIVLALTTHPDKPRWSSGEHTSLALKGPGFDSNSYLYL
jgi:hypothetical protein